MSSKTMFPDVNIVECVYQIDKLPRFPIFLLSFENDYQDEIFQSLRCHYHAVALWHRWKVLREDLSDELIENAELIHLCQASIISSNAWLDFVTELYPRSDHPEIRAFPSPASLWLQLHIYESEIVMDGYGLTGTPIIAFMSKRRGTKELRKIFDALHDQRIPVAEVDSEIMSMPFSSSPGSRLFATLLLEGLRLSEELPNEFDKYYRQFMRRKKKALNTAHNRDSTEMFKLVNFSLDTLPQEKKQRKLP